MKARTMKTLALVATVVLIMTACADSPTPAPTTAPGSRSPTAAPSAVVSGVPSPTPAAASPDPKKADLSKFLRAGTTEVSRVLGDMNGVPPEEIVLHSRSNQPGPNGLAAQEYVDAFSWHPGKKTWEKVFDATTFEDLPNGGRRVLETDGGVSQAVDEPLAMVDFAQDGNVELVLPVASSGASAGPLDLWIFSWLSESFTSEFLYSTERGGSITLNPDRTLTLEAGEYAEGDPGCCPSQIATRRIGYDSGDRKIKVLETKLRPAG